MQSLAKLSGPEKALKLKEKGNYAFKRKEYEVAEKFYSKGLRLDGEPVFSRSLWTNRAICRNNLGKHGDALGDCLVALFIDPNCTKVGFQNE